MNNNPTIKLSFVVTGRNDDYGGNMINRVSTFVRTLSFLLDKYKIPSEIVFVEYNPVPEKKYLFQEIPILHSSFVTIRGIVVPVAFHDKVKRNKIPLLEYYGKNIGIRRAKGQYILATNPDIIFSEEIIMFFAETNLKEDCFYRADRHEITDDYFSSSLEPQDILRISKDDVFKILYSPRTHYVSYKLWFPRVKDGWRNITMCPALNFLYPPDRKSLYENASGDFLLAHHSVFAKARGYDEAPHNLHHDSLMLHVLKALGYRQEILSGPIYHINHLLGRAGRPGIEYAKYRDVVDKMDKTGIPVINNSKDWGFVNEKFEEYIF